MHNFPERLIAGYRSFLDGRFEAERRRYRQLAEHGQRPSIMVIACCDSRAAPETIFDAGPGELFVLRNVANLVPPFEPDGGQHGTSAAIEFAVTGLGVSHIVVLGHGRCGGIHAALNPSEDTPDGDFIAKWMDLVRPLADEARARAAPSDAERQTALERASVAHSIENLRTFPYIAAREAEGALHLHGAWFDIGLGELWVRDAASGEFARPER